MLASMSFFKRSGTYFGRVWYKNDVKTAKTILERMCCIQASDYVIMYLNKNKFFVALSKICDIFYTLTSKNAIFICLGEIRFFRL